MLGPAVALRKLRQRIEIEAMIPGPCSKSLLLAVAALLALLGLGAAPASEFGSFAHDEVNLREGPSYQHRVVWIYHRKDLPVEVIGQYDIWRHVRVFDGATGWIHMNMLSPRRTVVVTSARPVPIRDDAGPGGKAIAFAQHGVVAKLEACKADACEIMASGTEGWVRKQDIWGVRAGEVF